MRKQQPGEKTPAGALICDGQYNPMRRYLSRYARQIVPALKGEALPCIDNTPPEPSEYAWHNGTNATHGSQESYKACCALNAYLLQTSGAFPGGGLQNFLP
jgi:hypothetical protein